MKKLICLSLLLATICTTAFAEEWYTLAEIYEETPVHWTETIETKWRDISIDANIIVPEAAKFPVVMICGGATEPTLSPEEAGWDKVHLTSTYRLTLSNNVPSYPKSVDGVRIGTPFAEGNWYSGFAPENQYVPLDDITFGEIVDHAREKIALLGYDPYAFDLDAPVRLWTMHAYAYGKKKDVLPGYMYMEVLPRVNGIPVLSHIWQTVKSEGGWARDDEFKLFVTTTVGYNGYYGDLSNIFLTPLTVCETLAEDVPLRSFEIIRSTIREEIEAGHIRKIYEIQLGYVLYNEPGKYHTAEPGDAYSAESDAARYYARPMWQVNCLYKDTATGKLRSKPSDSDDERNTLDYYQLLIDAQTGEVVRRSNAQDRCEYKGFISWEDVQ